MSSVKALPLGHITSPMYVVMDSSHALKKSVQWPSPHEGNSQYKRQTLQSLPHGGHHSPPLAGMRGYPYPQDPASRCSTSTSYVTSASSSPHLVYPGGGASVYASANHLYRENHFQVDSRQVAENHHVDRFGDQHVRRRLSLRPAPTQDYSAALERERYMDAMRYHQQYEREVAMYPTRSLKAPVVSVHTPSELDTGQPVKRPRLAVEPKPPVHQPLLIDTRSVVIKKEPAYTPQVEAISPTLPPEEGRCESPMRSMKENILENIKNMDKNIAQVECEMGKLQKKINELEAETSKPTVPKESTSEATLVDLKQMSIAQIIYSENRSKAQESHSFLEKFLLGRNIDIPMYNQPSDTAVYHENKRRILMFRSRLMKYFKKRHREKSLREKHLTESYSKLTQEWLKKMEKKESNTTKKAKDAKLREFFEKQFPELKKQREDRERISRVSQRIRSESEWEEIIDGLQEQEMEEKKMRSYAVIPPILLDNRQRRLWYNNSNGVVENLGQEYKEKQMLNIWTDQEKELFREKYLQHPKNFGLIASYLERKTVADCVQYYYLSKKSENYKTLLRKHSVRKRRAMVKNSQNQPQVSTTTGVTTRQQQEEAKTSSLGLPNSTPITSTTETPSQAQTDATSTTNVDNSSPTEAVVSASSSVTTTVNIETTSGAESTNKSEHVKIPLPNNIRKKKEAALQMEEKEDDSDTASDNHNEAMSSQPCVVCHMVSNQSRALTKSNCTTFGIKEGDLVPGMQVCAQCRFKSVCRRCPVPTCRSGKKKVKRLRPLPPKLNELSKEVRDSLLAEFQITQEITKCCSACFNRIIRRHENNSAPETEVQWTDYEMDLMKQGLNEHGTKWEAIATTVGTKSKEQCRSFYFSYKHKLNLDEIVQEYKKSDRYKADVDANGKPPPNVTDEEESGETTSSCDEDDRADRCSSDTASAPSPIDKILTQDKIESKEPQAANPPCLLNPDEMRVKNLMSQLDASPKCQPDYDSSATVSADEGLFDGRDPSPRVISHLKIPNDISRKQQFQSPLPIAKDPECRQLDTSVPLVKTLLQDPKIGATNSSDASSYMQHATKTGKDEPTCVRDLIYQAIEMSLQFPVKVGGRNSSPIPNSLQLGLKTESPDIIMDSKKDMDISGGVLIPPTAHGGSSRHPSRPNSHHMEAPQPDFEVQDLSKKIKSRDVSPVKDFTKREQQRVLTPSRPPSTSSASSSSSHIHYYGAPPPAHSNMYRVTQPPPPALSPHYVAEPPSHHESFYSRSSDNRGNKGYMAPERPHSQPPHLIAQSPSSALPPHAKSMPMKTQTVPPPPPLVASKPSSQMSPKMYFKDNRLVSIPPSGSITQGTPMSQQTIPIPPTNLTPPRYEGFLRQLPPPQSKDGGSITLGTPVQHDSSMKRVPSRPEPFVQNLQSAVPAMYDPGVMEYYRQVTPGGAQQYAAAFAPGSYPHYNNNTTSAPPRPPYANESQLSTKQIMIDFNTSKQMQLRRGGNEKDMKVSPRGSDSSPAPIPQENHLHSIYAPPNSGNFQGNGGTHYNHVPPGYQPDSRYMHHRSPNTQVDRTRSPSGVESPLNAGYPPHPGKRSPSLNVASNRQNVIHRSITWGTAKTVIQAPQSASPRTSDMRTETVSPASIRKSTPSPRHPQPMMYPAVPPSGHDAFNTLVNAAVAQPSLTVPKDGKGSPTSNNNSRSDVKSPRERPVVEGLEKTLMDMHQRPRSYTESSHDRMRSGDTNEQLNERYAGSLHSGSFERDHRMMDNSAALRLGSVREPFSREHFERQMRQPNISASREREYNKKDERDHPGTSDSHASNYPGPSPQQSDLDNEASKIFSQSFQKDAPRSSSSPRGFTAANLIDAIITRQINQNVESPAVTKNSGIDIFSQYNSNYEDKGPPKVNNGKPGVRTEVVTIDDEPETEKVQSSWSERHANHARSPPVTSNSVVDGNTQFSNEKVYTLSEHIAAIISKDYNSPSEATQSQPHFSTSQPPTNTSVSASTRQPLPYVVPNSLQGKTLDGPFTNSPLPLDPSIISAHGGAADHSPQNCPGNGCSYHTHSWKLRRALQQDKDREQQRSLQNESLHKRPSSNQNCDVPQEERQIIRVAQTSSPASTRTSPNGPYGVEPISPPSQPSDIVESSKNQIAEPPAWASNPSITGLLTARHMYPQEYSDEMRGPPAAMAHYNVPGNRAPLHQQQMGLSPLDYVKNRIVEVMRTATDSEPETETNRRPQSAMSHHSDDREQIPHNAYRFAPDRGDLSAGERPGSTGNNNGPPLLQGQRYSPAVSRYSPIPPRPASATTDRVPSRNSTPGAQQLKRGSDHNDWKDNQSVSSRASSRSVSPSSIEHQEGGASRKKTRTEGTFIPESTTGAPLLLPQVHRSGSMSDASRHTLDSQSGAASKRNEYMPTEDMYKFRDGGGRPEWGLVNSNRISDEPSTTMEPFSPSNSRTEPRQSPIVSSERGSPSMPARSTPYSFTGGVSSSTGVLYSTTSSLPPPSPHVAAYSFPAAYPYSALSMRTTTPSTTVSSSSATNQNSVPSNPSVSRMSQPPPLLSSQYEPLSDED